MIDRFSRLLRGLPVKNTLRTLLVTASFFDTAAIAHAQTTAFAYSGFLTDNGAPANGVCNLTFTPFNAGGGSAVGATDAANDLAIANGAFAVAVNFGNVPFDGSLLRLL